MTADSANTQPPDFGPQFSVYPNLPQLVRITGPAIGGTSIPVYPCVVIQVDGPALALRDREAAYLIEPNRIALGPGYYDSRLVSSYGGRPLYATTCCPTGSFSSSSASSLGG